MQPRLDYYLMEPLIEFCSRLKRLMQDEIKTKKDDVTKYVKAFSSSIAIEVHEPISMKFDIFEGSTWRNKVSNAENSGPIEIQLSSGKTVIVDSKFLGFLRVLAEELAAKENIQH